MAAAPLPFHAIGPAVPASPVVLSAPHSGRDYSPALLATARLPRASLEVLEDPQVDRLLWRAVADGAAGFVARVPRAEIDLNRDESDLDPAMVAPPPPNCAVSQRARGGLGLIPSRIGGAGALWLRRLPATEVARRVADIHRPYHAALAVALAAARDRFGAAVLLDCHSMPPGSGAGGAAVVIGDRFGASAAPAVIEAACAAVRGAGFSLVRNAPYAGGYITRCHGRPADGIHALQIEIDRARYLAPDLRYPGPGFDTAARLIAAVAAAVGEAVTPQALAAE